MQWKWKGTLWDFVDTVQWAMLMHELAEEQKTDLGAIMSSSDRVVQEANARGITRRAIVREMLRIAQDGMEMYRIIDEKDGECDDSDHGQQNRGPRAD